MSLDLFSEYFYLDETSPSGLRWKREIRSGNGGRIVKNKVGAIAGNLDHRGYWNVQIGRKIRKCHRIILTLLHGEIPEGLVTDHINRNPSDNSVDNLRLVPMAINCKNLSFNKSNTSGVSCITYSGPTITRPNNNHWIYRWYDVDNKRHSKCFSINKHGSDVAFEMACAFKSKMLQNLILIGYTCNHGEKNAI